MKHTSLKLLLVTAMSLSLTQCKTPGTASAVKGDGDVSDGLNTNAGNAKERTKWAYRMGIVFADDGSTVDSVMPAHFAQSVGVAKGDVVIALNGQAVSSAETFEQVAKTYTGLGNQAAQWNGVWVVKVRRGSKEFDMQAQKNFDCDPYMLVGCGPLND